MRTKLKAVMARRFSPTSIVSELVRLLGTGTPNEEFASRIAGALRAGDIPKAVSLAADPPHTEYEGTYDFLLGRQIAGLVRKVPWDSPDLDPLGAALRKFQAVEHRMRRINTRFRVERHGPYPERYCQVRARARRYIRGLIGEKPIHSHWYSRCDFGPGASLGVHGTDTSIPRKIEESQFTVTPTCLPYAIPALMHNAQLREYFSPQNSAGVVCFDDEQTIARIISKVVLVPHNKIAFVPKTASVHRTIAVEPLLNTFVQKGVDDFLRTRLETVGVDLHDQSYNQKLARIGSMFDMPSYATIDLESASDSVSRETVRDLFPADWYDFLIAISPPSYLLPGSEEPIRYQKLASMGNGICFPVETLIFWSLIQATLDECNVPRRYSAVYGDDIIVPQGAALYLIEILNFYGFRTNRSKTFVFGPFRESCGADWLEGRPVRPYILDFLPVTQRDLMKIYNGMLLRGTSDAVSDYLLGKTRDCPARIVGSTESIDSALLLETDAFMTHWSAKWDRTMLRWNYLLLQDKPVSRRPPADPSVMMYCVLRGSSEKDGAPDITLRRKTRTLMRRETHLGAPGK